MVAVLWPSCDCTVLTLAPAAIISEAAVCLSSWAVTRGNFASAAWHRLTAAPNQCVVVGGRNGCPSARHHNSSSVALPTMAGAKSLSTDADTATERAACVLVVPMTVLEFTFDADRSMRMR